MTTDNHAHFTGEGSFCDFPGCESGLRDRLIDALTAVQPRFVISDDGVKVVAEDTVDALLPVIEQYIRENHDKQAERGAL